MRWIIFASLLSCALSGCTVGPDFHRPDLPNVGNYVSSTDPVPVGITYRSANPSSVRWWQAFGCPALNELVDQAIAHNRTLQASDATLTAARETVRAVAGAQLPQVGVNGQAAQEEVNLANYGFEGLVPGGNPEFHLYSVGGGVSYDIDLFGRGRRQVEQARANGEAQLHQTEAAHLTIAGQVVNQVLTIAGIRAQMAIVDSLLADDRKNTDLSQKRMQAGDGTLVEVLSAQSQYAADRTQIPDLQQRLAQSRHTLAILLGVAPATLGATDFDLAQFRLPMDIPVALPSSLVHQRPDILEAEADLHAATAAVGIATARLYPDISIGATLTQAASGAGNIFKDAFRGYDLFAGLTAPIFSGGTLKAQRNEAVANARSADATYQQTVLVAFGQVADLLTTLRTDSDAVSDQRQAANVASHALQLSRQSFDVGDAGILQVLDTERLYQQATSGLAAAQTRQYVNVARLYVATAGGWAEPGPQVTRAR